MDDFIKQVASRLQTSEGAARSATGGALAYIRDAVGESEFARILDKIPGAGALLNETGPAGGESVGDSGGLGGLLQSATSALGGRLGSTVGLLGALKGAGLDVDQAGSFVTMLVDFLKRNLGEGPLAGILGKVPELETLAG